MKTCFPWGSLTLNPFYVIYRHELSKILRELAINGAKVEIFGIRGKMVISHVSIVKNYLTLRLVNLKPNTTHINLVA